MAVKGVLEALSEPFVRCSVSDPGGGGGGGALVVSYLEDGVL